MQKPNNDLRMLAKGNGIPLWMISDKLSVSEQTLIRHWRRELSLDEKEQIRSIIEELKAGAKDGELNE